MVLGLAVLGWPGWWWKPASGLPRPGALADGLMLVEVSGLLGWRRFPVGAFLVVQAASVAYGGLGYPAGPTGYAGLAMVAVVAARCQTRWVRLGALVVALGGVVLIDAGRRPTHGLVLLAANGALVLLAWAAGMGLHLMHERALAVGEAARQGSLRQAEIARRHVAEARLIAAAQLHDGIGHALAGALREAEAVGQVDEARRTVLLGRLQRRLHDSLNAVGELVVAWGIDRSTPSVSPSGVVPSPSPPVQDATRPLGEVLGEWITTLAAAGLRVELVVDGQAERASPRVEQALAAVVAEGAANVARHSAATAIRIELHFGAIEAVAQVIDPGPAREPDP
ncbi:MAG: sensor histidine kinase, partial [Acidimicrobiales bacterium]